MADKAATRNGTQPVTNESWDLYRTLTFQMADNSRFSRDKLRSLFRRSSTASKAPGEAWKGLVARGNDDVSPIEQRHFITTPSDSQITKAYAKVGSNQQETVDAIYSSLQLSGQQIRLVALGPAENADTVPICTLKVVKLSARPVFEALSWAWGDPSRTQPIILQNRMWQAPENLVSALKCLRLPHKSRTLWIDALCINQSTEDGALKERGHQVELMKYVYSLASHVVIWMGIPDVQLAEFLGMYAFQNQSLEDAARANRNRTTDRLIELVGLPWWRRLWVFQESALASKASMYFGSEGVELRHFLIDVKLAVAYVLSREDHTRDYPGKLRLRNIYPSNIMDMIDQKDYWEDVAGNYRQQIGEGIVTRHIYESLPIYYAATEIDSRSLFVDLLINSRYQLTSDPRDKIYALLGLADEIVSAELTPNYEEAAAATFVRTAERLIFLQRSLYILSQVDRQNTLKTMHLPSWVPNWSVPLEARSIWSANFRERKLAQEAFRACSDNTAMVTLLDDKILKTRGICVDEIASSVSRKEDLEEFRRWSALTEHHEYHTKLKEYDCSQVPTLDCSLFRTLNRVVGVGHANTKIGDRIFVLPGGHLPFVLRRTRLNHYKLAFFYLANLTTASSLYYLASNTSTITPAPQVDTDKVTKSCALPEATDCDLVPKPWVAKFRHYTGRSESKEGRYSCGGTCTEHARPCPLTNDIDYCVVMAPHTNCIESDGQLLFYTCNNDSGLKRLACHLSADLCWFHPRKGGGKTWIYDEVGTHKIMLFRPVLWGEQLPPEGFDRDKNFGFPHLEMVWSSCA